MAKGYHQVQGCRGEAYEIVQLLRINGALIQRHPDGGFALRMSHKGSWKEQHITAYTLKQRFGHGSAGYAILRGHKRAGEIPVCASRRKAESLA